jgi:hypothetical protein
MTTRLPAVVMIALALALGACGGDDGSSGSAGTPEEQAGATGTTSTEERRQEQQQPQSEGEDSPALELDENQEPVPKDSVPPEERTDSPPRYTRKEPLSKEQLKAIERPIYEQSRFLCKRLGVAGMRREYRLQSSDPEVIAREVAERTYMREARDAVFSGCLAGLRSGD